MFNRCCLRRGYTHFGHNPWPLSEREDDRCCDACNDTRVPAARVGCGRYSAASNKFSCGTQGSGSALGWKRRRDRPSLRRTRDVAGRLRDRSISTFARLPRSHSAEWSSAMGPTPPPPLCGNQLLNRKERTTLGESGVLLLDGRGRRLVATKRALPLTWAPTPRPGSPARVPLVRPRIRGIAGHGRGD